MRTPTHHVLLLTFLVSAIVVGASHGARLDPALQDELSRVSPSTFVPVVVIMEDQGLSRAEHDRLAGLSPHERRRSGFDLLGATAERSQAELSRRLEVWRGAGAVRRARRLTIVNARAMTLRAELVPALLATPGVDRVIWDPPLDPEQLFDRGPGGADAPTEGATKNLARSVWWQLTKVKAPQCWSQGYDGTGVLVAVLDSGVDYDHADLSDHIYANPLEIPDNLEDDDLNGFVDDVRGWDFVDSDNDPMGFGQSDHGTLVAGIVAGDGTSGTNTGVAPGATLLPVRVVGGSWTTIIEGIDYAIALGADVIQMSVSQKWRYYPKPDYAGWRQAADNELALGVAHANSIGNEGDNQETDPIPYNVAAPGNCPAPWRSRDVYLAGGVSAITGVGAVAESDIAADYSSRGPSIWEDVNAFNPNYPFSMPPEYQDFPWSTGQGGLIKPDLVAPGPNTLSTALGGGYLPFEGTSAATPHVAGAMAILLQADSSLTPAELERILELTAVDLGTPGKDNVYGAGCLDIYAALLRVIHPLTYAGLEGTLRDAVTDSVLRRADVMLIPADTMRTNIEGDYAALTRAGLATVRATAFGYFPDTSVVVLPPDTTIQHDRWLTPRPTAGLWGTVRDGNGDPLEGVRLGSSVAPLPWVTSDSSGTFLLTGIPAEVPFTLEAIRFGHIPSVQTVLLLPGEIDSLDIVLSPGVSDDFELDQGWTLDAADTAPVGKWERCDPAGTWYQSTPVQPENDANAAGTLCYLTGNCNPGAGWTFSDVDYGTTSFVSPIFDATSFLFPVLELQRWFSNNTGGPATDELRIEMSADSGQTWTILESTSTANPSWVQRRIDLYGRLPITDAMRIRFVTGDLGSPSAVEAGIDDVHVYEDPLGGAVEDDGSAQLRFRLEPAAPNPFSAGTSIRFALSEPGPVRLAIYDVQGRWVRDLVHAPLSAGMHATSWDGRDAAGRRRPSGTYFYRLEQHRNRVDGRMVLLN